MQLDKLLTWLIFSQAQAEKFLLLKENV